jgi:hypothetical protein
MSIKSNLIIGLAAVAVSGALVFNGISRLRSDNSTRIALQNMPAQPATLAAAPADSANTAVDPAADSAATRNDADQTTDATDAVNAPDTNTTDADTAAAETDAQPVQPVQSAVLRVRSTTKKIKQVVLAAPAADSASNDADATAAAPDPVKPLVIPVGAAITVRLGEQLGSQISEEGQNFSGTVDQDVIVGGKTAIPAGSSVSGKVVTAKPIGKLQGEAKLELKITSVKVNNANLHVAAGTRTFGSPIKGNNKVGKFFKGLAKRAEGDEREVVLAENSAYSFTLQKSLQIQ